MDEEYEFEIEEVDMPVLEGNEPVEEFEPAEAEVIEAELSEAEPSEGAEEGLSPASEYAEILNGITALGERIDGLSQLFSERISRSDYEAALLQQHSDEIQEYRADLYKKITFPLLKEFIEFRDMVCSTINRARKSGAEEPVVSLSIVETYRDMLETVLDNYGIGLRTPQVGEDLKSSGVRAVGKVKTGDKELHGKIAAVMSDGYEFDGKPVSPAKVKVYVFDESLVVEEQEEALQSTCSEEQTACNDSAASTEESSEEFPGAVPYYDPSK